MRKKRFIKVIKRLHIGESEQKKAVTIVPKSKHNLQNNLSQVVKNWILESRENNRIKRLFSETYISNRQMLIAK